MMIESAENGFFAFIEEELLVREKSSK